MSKAILVIDTPKIDEDTKNGCRHCRYGVKLMSLSEDYLCNLTGEKSYIYHIVCKLKPIPNKNKYDVEKYAKVDYENNITLGHYLNTGWNECIDELLGEEK